MSTSRNTSTSSSSSHNFSLLNICSKVVMDGSNYNDWIRNIKMALRFEDKEYVLEKELKELDESKATPEEYAAYKKHYDDATKVACIMVATMSPELQRYYEDYWPFEMNKDLMEKYHKRARQEKFEVVKSLMACKMKEGESVVSHVQRMQRYIERLVKLNIHFDEELAIDMVLNSLPDCYGQFILTYHLNNTEQTLAQLHNLLQTAEAGMKGKSIPSTPASAPVLAIGQGKGKKRKGPPKQNWKSKAQAVSSSNGPKAKPNGSTPHVSDPKEAICFYCNQKGHWKRSCPQYLQDIKDGKVKPSSAGIYTISANNSLSSRSWVLDTGCGFHICSDLQGLKESEEIEHGRINLIMGNRKSSPVTKIGVYQLLLSNDVRLDLINCCYSSEMTRNIISFHALFRQGFKYSFNDLNGSISVYKNGVFVFEALPCDGVYETVTCVDSLGNSVLNIDLSNSVDKACLWHCRLGHINKKRIAQLQKDGVLESFDLKSDDMCESCLLGKMTKSPFTGSCERGEGLLDLIHTDVCGPFRSTTRDANRFYVTFTDDYSRYGYIYLIKHKSETFEKFKEFKHEVENQLGRKIKILRSDRGGEYLSTEFNDYLKECGIVSQLTPPRTPQLNGVAERRNRTLLDMVRSMMSRASLPIHFWGYALETAAHILNLVPTKKVAKTPHEMWTGKVPSLAHIKVWGCEAFVR